MLFLVIDYWSKNIGSIVKRMQSKMLQKIWIMPLKGYLHYKTITSVIWVTSVNKCHLRHRLRIFLFCRKVISHSQDFVRFCKIFNHHMIYQICDIMMNISAWTRCSIYFQYILMMDMFWIYLELQLIK